MTEHGTPDEGGWEGLDGGGGRPGRADLQALVGEIDADQQVWAGE